MKSLGWVLDFVFEYSVFGLVWHCHLHGIDLECWWTGIQVFCLCRKGTRVTHYHEQGSCRGHVNGGTAVYSYIPSCLSVPMLYQMLNILTITSARYIIRKLFFHYRQF